MFTGSKLWFPLVKQTLNICRISKEDNPLRQGNVCKCRQMKPLEPFCYWKLMIINADKRRNNTFPQMMPEVHICWSLDLAFTFFYQPLYLCCLLHFERIWSAGLKVLLLMVNRIIIRSIVWFTWNSKPVWLIFQGFFFFFFLIYCVGGCLHKCRMSLIFYFAFPSRNPESLLQCFENRQQILKVFLRLYLPENTTLNTTFHRVSQSLLILWLKVLLQTEPNSNIRCTFKWANIWWGQKSDIVSRKQPLRCC